MTSAKAQLTRISQDVSTMRPNRRWRVAAFTLIELTIVVALLSAFVGMTVLSLDGVSLDGRLRSAAQQIAAFDRLARIEAVSSGEPRLLVLEHENADCVIKRPRQTAGVWIWTEGHAFHLGTNVHVEQLVQTNKHESETAVHEKSVRIHADGTSADYGCILSVGDASITLLVDGVTGEHRMVAGANLEVTAGDSWINERMHP